MKLSLQRIARKPGYTIGKLSIDGAYFCDTLEDTDRGLKQTMTVEEIKRLKQAGITAIPAGTYYVLMHIVSPKYSTRDAYKHIGGKLPRLANVPGYDGVLIHIGNYPKDTEGCILVGKNKAVGAVLESTETFNKLYPILKAADDKGEQITITIE
ncbi:MAG: DUF5675 family protein [Prevotellaceae bacterium]|jgi:recombinational DNA repair protein RecR|nr:DUF5675 family protein [Prevotellaceae bacterium]